MPGLSFLLPFLDWILSAVIKWRAAQGPSQLQQESEKAGAAEASLETEKQTNVEITQTAQVAAVLAAVVADPVKLRQYAATDPNNRDNGNSNGAA